MADSTNPTLTFNGINGATGDYLQPPTTARELVAQATAQFRQTNSSYFKTMAFRAGGGYESLGLRYDVNAEKLDEAGWGVVFAAKADPAVRDALRSLLDRRRDQATAIKAARYREFSGDAGYRAKDTAESFLARQKMAPGPPNPDRVPYYLLIVGDPESIPFAFQYQMDVLYAVGRLWFDTLDEYARYARTVVMAETGQIRLPTRAALFGTANPDDQATGMSSSELVTPLAAAIRGRSPAWTVDPIVGPGATKERLRPLLGGADTPALLFTASHGMGFPRGHPLQATDQGALLCQNWPGPIQWRKPVPRDFYFAGADVPDDAKVAGMISFHFACYGAGTPRLDDYPTGTGQPETIADRAFVARLPRRLLGHPNGGALAVIGHVERAWGCSIVWRDAGPQIDGFEDALFTLMDGKPAGMAMESLNLKYAALSSNLSAILTGTRPGGTADEELAGQLTASNDARLRPARRPGRPPAGRDGHAAVSPGAGTHHRRPPVRHQRPGAQTRDTPARRTGRAVRLRGQRDHRDHPALRDRHAGPSRDRHRIRNRRSADRRPVVRCHDRPGLRRPRRVRPGLPRRWGPERPAAKAVGQAVDERRDRGRRGRARVEVPPLQRDLQQGPATGVRHGRQHRRPAGQEPAARAGQVVLRSPRRPGRADRQRVLRQAVRPRPPGPSARPGVGTLAPPHQDGERRHVPLHQLLAPARAVQRGQEPLGWPGGLPAESRRRSTPAADRVHRAGLHRCRPGAPGRARAATVLEGRRRRRRQRSAGRDGIPRHAGGPRPADRFVRLPRRRGPHVSGARPSGRAADRSGLRQPWQGRRGHGRQLLDRRRRRRKRDPAAGIER